MMTCEMRSAAGKPVPPEVLVDYPDLAKQAKAAKAAPAPVGQLTEAEGVAGLPIPVAPDDVSYELAYDAHRWNSLETERRARQVQQDYMSHLIRVYEELKPFAETPEQQELLRSELERYRSGYLAHLNAILQARSNTTSPMVTGASNFPTARNQKWLDAEQRHMQEMTEWQGRTLGAIKKRLEEERTPAQVRDAEFGRLKRNIDENIAFLKAIEAGKMPGFDTSAFKQSIAGMIKRSIDSGNTEAARRALEYLREVQKVLQRPVLTEKHSIWTYAPQVAPEVPTNVGQEKVAVYEGARVVNNYDEERVQIFFDGTPSAQVRQALKAAGWHWSPTNGTWQRKNTVNATASAKAILGEHLGVEKQTSQMVQPQVEATKVPETAKPVAPAAAAEYPDKDVVS